MRKLLVYIYCQIFLPRYSKWFGKSYESLRQKANTPRFDVEQIYVGPEKQYVGNNVVPINSHLEYIPVLLHAAKLPFFRRKAADFYYIYGAGMDVFKHWLLRDANRYGIPKVHIEDGFLRSIDLQIHEPGISLLIDDVGMYYDARSPSRLENMLNSDRHLTDAQLQRARDVMQRIRDTKVTKYNISPIYKPEIGRPGRKKVLVLDQAYQDFSISFGLASDQSFDEMLQMAIVENPAADIIVKTHPEAFRGGRRGYFTHVKEEERIFPFTKPVCPLSLLECVDKVYCVTTQMGFEALICGKEVVCFGAPFYSGWGITDDRVQVPRRTSKRTLEEIFYYAYIEYSKYMNPNTNELCEIEEAIDYLVEQRTLKV